MSIKVLTVEDSKLIQLIVNNTIKTMDGVELIGTAVNGSEALKKIQELQPDIITLDLVMPVMDGLETLEKLRTFSDIPVIILSASSDKETTLKALEKGAQDFLTKPDVITRNREQFKENLELRIKALANQGNETQSKALKPKNRRNYVPLKSDFEAIVIGASTGGPKVLAELVQSLPSTLSIPIFIVQHMPKGFTASFAERLNSLAQVPVVEAEDGMAIERGTVYIAPGGKHMVLNERKIELLDTAKINRVKPAIDPLFESATKIYGKKILAVVLTGMGKDGAQGCMHVKETGGRVIVQDEATSVVYGMPKSCVDVGVVDAILSMEEIIDEINERVKE